MSYDEQPDGDPHGECAAEIHRLQRELADARAERDAAVRDAERYRWLKAEAKQTYMHPNSEIDNRMRWEFPILIALTCIDSEVPLDAAIDAAIAARKP